MRLAHPLSYSRYLASPECRAWRISEIIPARFLHENPGFKIEVHRGGFFPSYMITAPGLRELPQSIWRRVGEGLCKIAAQCDIAISPPVAEGRTAFENHKHYIISPSFERQTYPNRKARRAVIRH